MQALTNTQGPQRLPANDCTDSSLRGHHTVSEQDGIGLDQDTFCAFDSDYRIPEKFVLETKKLTGQILKKSDKYKKSIFRVPEPQGLFDRYSSLATRLCEAEVRAEKLWFCRFSAVQPNLIDAAIEGDMYNILFAISDYLVQRKCEIPGYTIGSHYIGKKLSARESFGVCRVDTFKVYKGQMLDGQPEGRGKLHHSFFCFYEGSFASGKPHGMGFEASPKVGSTEIVEYVKDGRWEHGKPVDFKPISFHQPASFSDYFPTKVINFFRKTNLASKTTEDHTERKSL